MTVRIGQDSKEEDHMGEVGKSQVRVDAYDKATGRTKYYEDRMRCMFALSMQKLPTVLSNQ